MGLGESFRITFEATGSVDDDPDFSPLEADFEILGKNRSSNISIVNGNMSRKTQWHLTAMARQAGQIEIPAIAFGDDTSPPLGLTVTEQSPAKDGSSAPILVQVEATPKTAYVQQQIRYQVRLLRNVEIANATLSEPKLAQGDALIEKLGDDRTYETRQDGLRYIVVERNYAIFPQQSGPLTIAPVIFQGTVLQGRPSLLDPFGQNGAVKRVQSETLEISSKAVPQEFSGNNWLPSGQLRLVEEWSETPPAFKVGEPVTRTLTLYAEGLTAAQLPELRLPPTDGLKQYPDQPILENHPRDGLLVGARQEKIALVPTRAGKYRLPALEIPWWNTASEQMEVARLPEREIEVLPAAKSAPPPPPVQRPEAELQLPPKGQPDAPGTSAAAAEASRWRRISLGLATGWGLSLIAWGATRRKKNAIVPASATADLALQSHSKALDALKQSCRGNDPQQTKAALLQLARGTWGATAPTSLGELAGRCPARMKEELLQLSKALYDRSETAWVGDTLYRAVREEGFPAAQCPRGKKEPLEPLYQTRN